MNKKLGQLKIDTSADYYNIVVKTLEEAGFVLVLEYETTCEKSYIIAKAKTD